jgi:hypothetical protein
VIRKSDNKIDHFKLNLQDVDCLSRVIKKNSHHQKKNFICNNRFHGRYILFFNTMILFMNNKTHPYNSPQMFNNNLFLYSHHVNMVIV